MKNNLVKLVESENQLNEGWLRDFILDLTDSNRRALKKEPERKTIELAKKLVDSGFIRDHKRERTAPIHDLGYYVLTHKQYKGIDLYINVNKLIKIESLVVNDGNENNEIRITNPKDFTIAKIKSAMSEVQKKSKDEDNLSKMKKAGNLGVKESYVFEKKSLTEMVEEEITEGKDSYKVYHDSYTSSVDEMLKYIKANGFEVSDDEVWNQISTGPGRPKGGKTVRHTLELTKNGKPQRKAFHAQVYDMGNSRKQTYELNMYIA